MPLALDSDSGRPRFSLFNKEDAAAAAVASTSVALSGLTIIPSASSVTSLGWEHVGVGVGQRTPLAASSRASRLRRGVSVSLALMEVPSLSSFSPFSPGAFGGGVVVGMDPGGNNAWVPSDDQHAIGESRRLPLLKVTNDTSKFCLRRIGLDGRRFCWSTTCGIASHCKNRFKLDCQEGYFIATGAQGSARPLAAFRTPFLDASLLTPEVQAIITDPGEGGKKMTGEWEDFILQAKVSWHTHQESTRRSSQGIWEGSDKDNASSISGMYLPDEPANFMFAEPQEFGTIAFKKEMESAPGEEKEEDALHKVPEAINDLDQKMQLVLVAVRVDQVGMMDHLWSSIVMLGRAIEGLHAQICGMEQDVGDASELLNDHNLSDLSKGVLRALGQLPPAASSAPGLMQDVEDKIEALLDLINAVDEDHQKVGCYLLTKLNAPPPNLGTGLRGVAGLAGELNLGMTIVNDAGDHVGTLGQLLQGMEKTMSENAWLLEHLEALLADIASQGGIVLDGLSFTFEAQVREAVLRECPEGDTFEVFLDVMLLFCCDPVYIPAPGWEKKTCAMEDDFSSTARKVVSYYYMPHCAWHTDGAKVVSRKLLVAFKDADPWNGVSGMDGHRHEIETSAVTLAEIPKTWIRDKLPSNRKFAPLALKMIDCLVDWIHTVHKHLDLEFTKLTQQHIAEEEALILLSEEVIIMYMKIFAVHCQQMEFVANRANKIDCMVRCIWITCQVHRVMQEFVQGSLKHNPAICSAFIQFLMKQTAVNVASGIGSQIKTLLDTIATLKGLMLVAASAAKEAAQLAKEANTWASTANANADVAKNAVNSIYTKNSSLKR
jgi:hypothetical protein